MFISTMALIAVCFLGVIGVVDNLEPYQNAMIVSSKLNGSFAVGGFLFIADSDGLEMVGDDLKNHEYGHLLQERILGWRYYLLVGIPSLVLHTALYRNNISVSELLSKWPESWATELGGV